MDDNLMEARRWVKAERGLKKLPDPDHSAVVARLAEMRYVEAATSVLLEDGGHQPIEGTTEQARLQAKANIRDEHFPHRDENGCYTAPNGECVAAGSCIHSVTIVDDSEIAYKSKPRSPHHIPQPMREGATMSRQVRRQLERLAGKPRRPVSQMQALGLRVYGEKKA